MKRSLTASVVAAVLAFSGGTVALYANVHYVKQPENLLDWAVQVCGGMTFAIVIYFIVWGHFQERDQAE